MGLQPDLVSIVRVFFLNRLEKRYFDWKIGGLNIGKTVQGSTTLSVLE